MSNLRIKEAIKERGYTVADIAKKMSLHPSALSQTINGNPTFEKLQEIASILSCNVTDLIQENTTNFKCPCCGAELQLVEKRKEE